MYSVADLHAGLLVTYRGKPYKIIESQHTKLGRGGALARTKLRNLLDSSVVSETFKGNDKIEPATVERFDMQYLYRDRSGLVLMDLANYDQATIPAGLIGSRVNYLAEGSNVVALMYQGRTIDIEIPTKLPLKVKQTDPGLQGDTAKAALKPATLETDAVVQVPLFVKTGDKIIVDTRNGSYVERAG